VLFRRERSILLPWRDGRRSHTAIEADEYLAAVTLSQYSWGADVLAGRAAYFLTGAGPDSLWRLVRAERDLAGRQVLTLAPVQLTNGLPIVNFAPIADVVLREKLLRDWTEVQRCLSQHIYSSLITSAKNVAESLLVYLVGDPGHALTLDKGLSRLSEALKNKQELILPVSFLEYHLFHRLRILHGHTHADRTVLSGRLIAPEFAISVVADLVQILRTAGLAHQ
jgi:hypothetical protein